MLSTARSLWRLLAVLLALTMVAAACGDDDADDVAAGDDGTDATEEERTCETLDPEPVSDLASLELTDLEVNVGSKDFTEQIVLGEILVQALEEAGASVTNSTNLGGTSVNREALLAGEIDTYFEYNGTGWTVHLGREDPANDGTELTIDVCDADLEENDVRWIGKSPFNDTYGFATAPDFLDDGEPFTLQTMADYLAENEDATVCLETEFPNRPDGLVLFEDATGYQIPDDQIEILETGVIYEETASGNCDFGEVFTTDGRIPALDLNLVEDEGVFIIYNASLTMPDDVYQQAPEAFEGIAEAILEPLDEETMSELNRRVASEGEDPAAVARDYLETQGLV